MSTGFVAPVPVHWSDIDMYQHINHATMVTILEEARTPFLSDAAVLAETQLAAVHIDEQRLVRLSPHHREHLQRWLR